MSPGKQAIDPWERRGVTRRSLIFKQMPSRQKPAFIAPALPTLVAATPGGGEWTREVKHDGYRSMRIFTRRIEDYASECRTAQQSRGHAAPKWSADRSEYF
jgi:ATP-dependent DNA ligase